MLGDFCDPAASPEARGRQLTSKPRGISWGRHYPCGAEVSLPGSISTSLGRNRWPPSPAFATRRRRWLGEDRAAVDDFDVAMLNDGDGELAAASPRSEVAPRFSIRITSAAGAEAKWRRTHLVAKRNKRTEFEFAPALRRLAMCNNTTGVYSRPVTSRGRKISLKSRYWIIIAGAVVFSNMTGGATAASISAATAGLRTTTERISALVTSTQRHSHYLTLRNRNTSGSSGSSLQGETSGWYAHDSNVLAFGTGEWWRQKQLDHGCGQ
jgi:hypothetical protein